MQHYGSDVNHRGGAAVRHVDHILKKYPELLVALASVSSLTSGRSCVGRRLLRKDSERARRTRRLRRRRRRSLDTDALRRIRRFESALFTAMTTTDSPLFTCPVCNSILNEPVTLDCGHSFCSECLNHMNDDIDNIQCAICASDNFNNARVTASPTSPRAKCVNVLLQDLVEKWRERHKQTAEITVPNTGDILGIEPRYHLRSGFAGLRINGENMEIDVENPSPTEMISTADGKLRCQYDIYGKKFDSVVDTVFKEVENIKENALKCSWDIITPNDLECVLCSRCILDPVTTSCGHTFCRGCLTRVLDHGLSCPLCMSRLSVKDYSRGTNMVLDQAIKFLLPNDYKERLCLNWNEIEMFNNSVNELPVFVCTNAFPGVACPLHVYEPRYRLLVRRCLLSPTRRFAMAAKEGTGNNFVSYGTVLEVKNAIHLEDGSFILTTVGLRRFKVTSRGKKDGYDTANIQYIKDAPVPSDKLPELIYLHQKVYRKAFKWIHSLSEKLHAEVERLIGQMPKVESNWLSLPDGPAWAWWLMPILPLNTQLKVGFLSTVSLEKRLRAIDKMLERIEIRMKSLERNTLTYSASEHGLDSCSDPERTFGYPFNTNC